MTSDMTAVGFMEKHGAEAVDWLAKRLPRSDAARELQPEPSPDPCMLIVSSVSCGCYLSA